MTGASDPARPAPPLRPSDPPVFAILRRLAPDATIAAAQALADGGIAAVEVTIDSPDALSIVRRLRERLPDIRIGVGTVLDARDVDVAAAAGAQFVVSPHVDEAIIEASLRAGLPAVPGAATPTEAWRAWQAGASLVKLFPAAALGAAVIRAVRDPLPMLPLVAVGGVDGDNAAAFLAAGAVAVGIGSWLSAPADPAEIAARARELVRSIDAGSTT